jgi:hypothetical protein
MEVGCFEQSTDPAARFCEFRVRPAEDKARPLVGAASLGQTAGAHLAFRQPETTDAQGSAPPETMLP